MNISGNRRVLKVLVMVSTILVSFLMCKIAHPFDNPTLTTGGGIDNHFNLSNFHCQAPAYLSPESQVEYMGKVEDFKPNPNTSSLIGSFADALYARIANPNQYLTYYYDIELYNSSSFNPDDSVIFGDNKSCPKRIERMHGETIKIPVIPLLSPKLSNGRFRIYIFSKQNAEDKPEFSLFKDVCFGLNRGGTYVSCLNKGVYRCSNADKYESKLVKHPETGVPSILFVGEDRSWLRSVETRVCLKNDGQNHVKVRIPDEYEDYQRVDFSDHDQVTMNIDYLAIKATGIKVNLREVGDYNLKELAISNPTPIYSEPYAARVKLIAEREKLERENRILPKMNIVVTNFFTTGEKMTESPQTIHLGFENVLHNDVIIEQKNMDIKYLFSDEKNVQITNCSDMSFEFTKGSRFKPPVNFYKMERNNSILKQYALLGRTKKSVLHFDMDQTVPSGSVTENLVFLLKPSTGVDGLTIPLYCGIADWNEGTYVVQELRSYNPCGGDKPRPQHINTPESTAPGDDRSTGLVPGESNEPKPGDLPAGIPPGPYLPPGDTAERGHFPESWPRQVMLKVKVVGNGSGGISISQFHNDRQKPIGEAAVDRPFSTGLSLQTMDKLVFRPTNSESDEIAKTDPLLHEEQMASGGFNFNGTTVGCRVLKASDVDDNGHIYLEIMLNRKKIRLPDHAVFIPFLKIGEKELPLPYCVVKPGIAEIEESNDLGMSGTKIKFKPNSAIDPFDIPVTLSGTNCPDITNVRPVKPVEIKHNSKIKVFAAKDNAGVFYAIISLGRIRNSEPLWRAALEAVEEQFKEEANSAHYAYGSIYTLEGGGKLVSNEYAFSPTLNVREITSSTEEMYNLTSSVNEGYFPKFVDDVVKSDKSISHLLVVNFDTTPYCFWKNPLRRNMTLDELAQLPKGAKRAAYVRLLGYAEGKILDEKKYPGLVFCPDKGLDGVMLNIAVELPKYTASFNKQDQIRKAVKLAMEALIND